MAPEAVPLAGGEQAGRCTFAWPPASSSMASFTLSLDMQLESRSSRALGGAFWQLLEASPTEVCQHGQLLVMQSADAEPIALVASSWNQCLGSCQS